MAADFKALLLASECLGSCVAIMERDVRFLGNRVVELVKSRRMKPGRDSCGFDKESRSQKR